MHACIPQCAADPSLMAVDCCLLFRWWWLFGISHRFAQHLLSIPARVSERRAVYAHDPSVLAQLALKDAQRATKLRPQWAEVYACEVSTQRVWLCSVA
jgi:hypothetical protein